MTTDTTMTDVDTSKIAAINIVSALTHMMEKSGGASVEREVLRLAIEKIEALAAERDELERLAGEMVEALKAAKSAMRYRSDDRVLDRNNGCTITSYGADQLISNALAAFEAYQRKGE